MPRNGPGQGYTNRTDLARQPIRVAKGQEYGQRQAQVQAQRDAPLPQQPDLKTLIDQIAPHPPISRDTERPNEPLAAGLAVGPGAGPEALPLSAAVNTDDPRLWLEALVAKTGSPEAHELLMELRRARTFPAGVTAQQGNAGRTPILPERRRRG